MKADDLSASALFPLPPEATRFDAAPPRPPAFAAAASPAAAVALPALTPHELLVLLWRHRWLVGGCVLVVSAALAGLLSLQKPVYTSTAKVWVQTEQQGTPSFLSGIAAYRESQYAESVTHRIETEMELLMTRSSADNVVARLGLAREQFVRSPIAQATQWLRATARRLTGRAAAPPVDPLLAPSMGELFLETVTVQPLRSKTAETASNVLEIKVESTDPKLATRALSVLLDNYLAVGTKQTQKLGEGTLQLLRTRLTEARDELRRLDDELVALALRSSGRAETAVAAPAAPAGLPPQVVRSAADGGGGGLRLDLALDASRGGNPQAVSTLKTQTLELQAQLDQLRQVYTDDADNVRALRRRIDASRQRLATSVRAGVLAEAEFGRLERQRSLAQDRFVELQKKLDQIDLYLELNPAAVDSRVVIDSPSPPKQAAGKSKMLLMALGPIAGLLLGLLLAGVRELFDGRLRNAAEVERLLGLPVLAAIPRLPAGQLDRLSGADAGLGAAPMKTDPLMMARLALALLDRLDLPPPDAAAATDDGAIHPADDARRGRVVLVSSARAGEGKTFVAGLLHAALSAQQAYAGRVALLGGDMLTGRLVPGEKPLPGSAALLFQPVALRQALGVLRQRHALVVVDGSTLADCGALPREADAVLLVVDASRTPRRSIDGALAAARVEPARLAGVVLNRREAGLPRWLGAH